MKIIFATGNKHKIEEIKEILGDEIDIICTSDVGADIDVEEDGKTFKDNAMIKAMHVWKQIGGLVAADDSGLSIDALGGEPGILSARYMGKDTPYDKKCDMILSRMKDVKDDDRSARFTCAIAVILPDGTSFE